MKPPGKYKRYVGFVFITASILQKYSSIMMDETDGVITDPV